MRGAKTKFFYRSILFVLPVLFLLYFSDCLMPEESPPLTNILASYSQEGAEEIEFKNVLAAQMAEHKLSVCYFLENPHYFLEHTVPLYHVFPAPFCGSQTKRVEENISLLKRSGFNDKDIHLFENDEQIQSFFDNPKHTMFACAGTDWGKKINTHSGYANLGHGIDSDGLYIYNLTLDPNKAPTEDKALIFTKFLESYYPSKEEILHYYKADPERKTIVFLPTLSEYEFLDQLAPQEVQEKMMSELVKLSSKYNMVVRPHPLLGPAYLDFYQKNFTIAPPGVFPSFVPFYDAADVIIATPAGGGSVATSRAEKPLIILRPTHVWGSHNIDEISKRNQKFTLNESNVILQKEFDIDLEKRVEEALNDPLAHQRIEGRKAYFKTWFGCIDGYEEYRVFVRHVLKNRNLDTSALKKIYAQFPKYKGRDLCLDEF